MEKSIIIKAFGNIFITQDINHSVEYIEKILEDSLESERDLDVRIKTTDISIIDVIMGGGQLNTKSIKKAHKAPKSTHKSTPVLNRGYYVDLVFPLINKLSKEDSMLTVEIAEALNIKKKAVSSTVFSLIKNNKISRERVDGYYRYFQKKEEKKVVAENKEPVSMAIYCTIRDREISSDLCVPNPLHDQCKVCTNYKR